MFDYGDKVRVKDNARSNELCGKVGTVIWFDIMSNNYVVAFPFEISWATDCDGLCEDKHGLRIHPAYLERVYSLHDDDPTEEDYEYAEELDLELETMLFGR